MVVLSLTLMLVFTAQPTPASLWCCDDACEVAMANASSDAENRIQATLCSSDIGSVQSDRKTVFWQERQQAASSLRKHVKKFETTGTVRVVDATLVATQAWE